MKKKILNHKHFNQIKQTNQCNGLFDTSQTKQQLLQQLKTGTLFYRKALKHNIQQEQKVQQSKNDWLEEITLGLQQIEDLSSSYKHSNCSSNDRKIHKVEPLPILLNRIETRKQLNFIGKQQKAVITSKRCNKIVCLSKKLATIGAWNIKNKNNILSSIQKLQVSLKLSPKIFIQNDFRRVEGLQQQGLSFDQSIHYMDKSNLTQKHEFNPFKRFPNFTKTISSMFREEKLSNKSFQNLKAYESDKENINRTQKRPLQDSLLQKDYFLPDFLMKSLLSSTKE